MGYGWPFVAKFSNVYLYATIYIDSTSTQDIFIQRLYWVNFNTGYFCAKQIFIQLQQKNIFIQQNIFIQLFKFPSGGHWGGHEEEENSISRQFIEWVINRSELAGKFVENCSL